jgi:phosphoribosyl 1,2-cyclic phosphodiesterase
VKSWVLGSGSKGNALLLESGGARLLIDCGFAPRTLHGRLKLIGVAPESISAVVLTHEHIDHVKGVAAAAKKWRWVVLASHGTLAALPALSGQRRIALTPGATHALDAFDLLPLRIPHDAAEPVAFVVTATVSGARAGVATDLGEVPPTVLAAFERLDLLVLESNHDEGMLRAGPYPFQLQERILGRNGHLANRTCGATIAAVAHRGLRDVVLAHLSEVNNEPALARRTVLSAIRGSAFKGRLHVAAQAGPTGPVGPEATAGHFAPQYALAI